MPSHLLASGPSRRTDTSKMSPATNDSAIVWLPLAALKLNPRNARTHSKAQTKFIAKSIDKFGFLVPILIDEDNMILCGHGRLLAAQHLKMSSVPTLRAAGLSEAQKRAFVLADNKLAERAGWDRAILATEFPDLAMLLEPLDLQLTDIGFEAGEIEMILSDHEDAKPHPEDDLPVTTGPAVSRAGDLWILGTHRLTCGDARLPQVLDRLMDGALAAAMFADPPYNVPVAGHVQGRGRKRHHEFAFGSGEMSPADYAVFLTTSLGNAARVSREGAVHYVCMDWRHIAPLIEVGTEIYGAMLNLCVWNKTNGGQGSLYRSQHELVAVFRVGSEAHVNNVDLGRFGRNRSNVWTYPGANGFKSASADADHPTPKPVALVADAIRDCTAKGAIVLDPFMGSGTTLLAAERVGRRAYGVEYEPAYVDLCVRRWQTYTGRDAVLLGNGRCFSELLGQKRGPRAAPSFLKETVR